MRLLTATAMASPPMTVSGTKKSPKTKRDPGDLLHLGAGREGPVVVQADEVEGAPDDVPADTG